MIDSFVPYGEAAARLAAEFVSGLDDEARTALAEAMARIQASGAGTDAPGPGHRAPDFTLPDPDGEAVTLSTLLKQGPVVLNFFRGGWCPFCNLEFRSLHSALPAIEAAGASLVGVSPERPEVAARTREEKDLRFRLLCDAGNAVARRWGLVMQVPEVIRPWYARWGIDLPAANGDDSFELPLPATYVIGPDGVIAAAFVDRDYTRRMEPAEVVSALQALRATP